MLGQRRSAAATLDHGSIGAEKALRATRHSTSSRHVDKEWASPFAIRSGPPNLAALNQSFRHMELVDRLKFAVDHWGPDLGVLSGFGYSGMILLYHLKDIAPELPIYFIDTRRHFPQTLALVERARSEWNLDILSLCTHLSEAEIQQDHGPELHHRDPDQCCHLRKVEPFMRIVHSKRIWMNALRRDQALTRRDLDFFQLDARNIWRAYPLVDWTRQRSWDFIHSHEIFTNPLHDEHYMSIGCACCTSPVREGQEERHGRWQSQPKIECGLHAH